MKKEKELLIELLPILTKYDFKTVDKCLKYLLEGEKELFTYFNFVNGIESGVEKNTNPISNIFKNESREKKMVLGKIHQTLSTKSCTVEQIKNSFIMTFGKDNIDDIFNISEKNEIVEKLIRFLVKLDAIKISEFEQNMQLKKTGANENNLENWGKVIVKD